MLGYRVASVCLTLVAVLASAIPSAFAQPKSLGTFSWQFAPHCNVVTLDAVQQATTITLSGFDDQCGGSVAAAASGTAHLNPNGSVSVALEVTRPDGIVISSSIEVNIATISGPWKDNAGNSGTFVFNPALPATGDPRRITLKGVYSGGFTAAAEDDIFVSQFSFGRTLATAPSAPIANIIPFGGPPTTNCPGSFENPQALPGQLCLYERLRTNATYRVSNAAGTLDVADIIGAHVYTAAQAAGGVAVSGAWAVTIP